MTNGVRSMYQLSISFNENLREPKISLRTWQELSDYIYQIAQNLARRVDFSLINKLEKISDIEAPKYLYEQLQRCIYLDFMMCFLTYVTIESKKKKKADILREICHKKEYDKIDNKLFYRNHKGYLFNTYNKLKKCVDFFDIYDRKSFSSRIDEDFIRFCLTNAGSLPKKLSLHGSLDGKEGKRYSEHD